MLALPIFPASHPASIVGEGVLNFCVRDGNRWTHTPINTNFFGDCSPTKGYTLKTEHGHSISQITSGCLFESACSNCRSSPRLISISQLHTLLRFHL